MVTVNSSKTPPSIWKPGQQNHSHISRSCMSFTAFSIAGIFFLKVDHCSSFKLIPERRQQERVKQNLHILAAWNTTGLNALKKQNSYSTWPDLHMSTHVCTDKKRLVTIIQWGRISKGFNVTVFNNICQFCHTFYLRCRSLNEYKLCVSNWNPFNTH